MVARVREDVTSRQLLGQGEEGRVVGHVAGGEYQSRLLANHRLARQCNHHHHPYLVVQVGQLLLQFLVEERVARDVSSSSGTDPVVLHRITVIVVIIVIISRVKKLSTHKV